MEENVKFYTIDFEDEVMSLGLGKVYNILNMLGHTLKLWKILLPIW